MGVQELGITASLFQTAPKFKGASLVAATKLDGGRIGASLSKR
jgi:hypothetical protein